MYHILTDLRTRLDNKDGIRSHESSIFRRLEERIRSRLLERSSLTDVAFLVSSIESVVTGATVDLLALVCKRNKKLDNICHFRAAL